MRGFYGFEDIEDGDVLCRSVRLLSFPGAIAAAVDHHARNVEAAESHDDARHVLVASTDADDAVEEIAARDELDGVGDDFSTHQRRLHALRARR